MAVTKSSTKENTSAAKSAVSAAKATPEETQAVKDREAEGQQPADIPAVESNTDFSPSGAPRQNTEFDPGHPAVDNNPRAGTTVDQNKIDFNDPNLTMEEAVEKNLKEGGSGTVVEGSDAEQKD